MYCSIALTFAADLTLRLLGLEEWIALSADEKKRLGDATAVSAMLQLYGFTPPKETKQ